MPGDKVYSSRRWRALRLLVIREQPVCCICGIRPSAVVDHIEAHKGNDTLMWLRSNLQGLCKRCHDTKTASTDNDFAFGRWQRIPSFLQPSKVPLEIVCGPPGAGKSTYVDSRANLDCAVIDVDRIAAEVSGELMHRVDMRRWMAPTMLERNNQLAELYRSRAAAAFFIVGGARLRDRRKWANLLKPTRIVVLETDPALCIDRIKSSQRIDKKGAIAAVGKWWDQYVPDHSDSVLRAA